LIQKAILQPGGSSVTYYALGALFIAPLLIGIFMVRTSVDSTDQANQASRDLASMYAQGVDFSSPANQKIAFRVAEGMGLMLTEGKAVVILSKLRMVRESDCAPVPAAQCKNKGYPVIVQRYVLGNARLRTSSFGDPAKIDSDSGNVVNWATDTTARAREFSMNLKPGESTYAAECYMTGPDSHAGVYSRAMY